MTLRANLAQIANWIPQAQYFGAGSTEIIGISHDSRDIKPGSLFIALQGERFDGHAFLLQAQQQGAVAALVSTYHPAIHLPQVLVKDTRAALIQLAGAWRQTCTLPLVLVIGSNGKTTVKEMLAAIFTAAVGKTHCLATRGNYNNEIGLPLTLLRLEQHHRLAVIELGMNHPGETVQLAQLVQPSVVLINNAQREHQEFMASVAAVAHEHGTALKSLSPRGIAVFPADSEYNAVWRNLVKPDQIIDFSLHGQACVTAHRVTTAQDHSVLLIHTPQGEISVTLHAVGEHNIHNALAACAAALAVGVNTAAIRAGLQAFTPVKGRLQIKTVDALTTIDDTYNANPDSVRAAIDVLASMTGPRTLILGDMGEVGEQGVSFHREIGAYAKSKGIDTLLTVGTLSQHACESFGANGQHFADTHLLCDTLQSQPLPQCGTVLVKGSRFMAMERILPLLQLSVADVATTPVQTSAHGSRGGLSCC